MDSIQISLQEVSNAASRISSLNRQIYDLLQAMKKDMNSLDATWISDGGNEIRMRFNLFSARFDSQRDVIDSYVRFLEITVSSYDSLETAITGNASTMAA